MVTWLNLVTCLSQCLSELTNGLTSWQNMKFGETGLNIDKSTCVATVMGCFGYHPPQGRPQVSNWRRLAFISSASPPKMCCGVAQTCLLLPDPDISELILHSHFLCWSAPALKCERCGNKWVFLLWYKLWLFYRQCVKILTSKGLFV